MRGSVLTLFSQEYTKRGHTPMAASYNAKALPNDKVNHNSRIDLFDYADDETNIS